MRGAPPLALLALAYPVCAGDFDVNILGVTSTQAVLHYTAPDSNPCRIEVSESNSYTPSVPDFDRLLFSGADSDARAGSLSDGPARVVVLGRQGMAYAGSFNPFLGSDGRRHSRALAADTTHYFRVTCGAQVSEGTFRTANIALGNTRGEPLPPDPLRPGTYNWPDPDPADRFERIVVFDPHIRLESIYGSNERFILKAIPHIGAVMDKDFTDTLAWSNAWW